MNFPSTLSHFILSLFLLLSLPHTQPPCGGDGAILGFIPPHNRDLLDICLIIYLDDLLIYSKTQEEHDSHVLLVLKRLRENGLYAKLEKCSFDCKQVEFLGYVVAYFHVCV